jgi:hypothetical protein
MKNDFSKFILRFFLFILILTFLVAAINSIYAKFIIKKQQYYRQISSYEEYIKGLPAPKKINYAFFGDSHARNGVNPSVIGNSFNFGTSAENYIETYYKLKKIIEVDNIKIDTAIFEVDLITFSSLLTDKTRIFDDLYYFHNFVPFAEVKKLRNASNLEMLKIYFSEVYFPAIGKGEDFLNIFIEPKLTEVYLGWTKEYEDYTLLDMESVALKTYGKQFANQERISSVSLEYFLKTLELAKENNINIIFIKYPISNEYDGVMKEKGFDRGGYYEEISNKIRNKLGDNYVILDYYNLFFDHSEYFTNPDHLNYKGAEIISERIKEDLK